MTPEQMAAQLVALRAQAEAFLHQVDAILSALAGAVESPAAPSDGGDDTGCPHPTGKRVAYQRFGGDPGWICADCGYEHSTTED